MNKVLLASMRSPFLDDDKVYPSLGTLYLQAALDSEGIKSKIEDEFDYNRPEKYDEFDIWSASVMTPQKDEADRFLDLAKAQKKIAVIGGPHPTFYFNEVAKKNWDHIVMGDGEKKILDIAYGYAQQYEIDNLTSDQLASFPRPTRLQNKELLKKYHYKLRGKEATSLITGRGCPMSCGFCEAARTKIKYSPLERIVEELDDIRDLGYSGVYIFDDLFAMNKIRTRKIGEELRKRNLVFRCNGHARLMDREYAKELSDLGCVEIAFGAESGSQKILDIVQKKTTVKQNYDFVNSFKGLDVRVKAFLMVGLPGETYDTIKDTEDFIKNSGIDDFQLAVFYPYKGTPIREYLSNYDLRMVAIGIGAYGQKGGESECVVETSGLTSEQIKSERDRIVKKYKNG